jgi:hypothetical protein
VAELDTDTRQFASMDEGTNGSNHLGIDVAEGGRVYLCGDFTTVGSDPVTANYVAIWNGTAWQPMGDGLVMDAANDVPDNILVTRTGEVFVSGDIEQAGGRPANGLAFWNSSIWANFDIEDPDAGLGGFFQATNGDLYMRGGFGGANTLVHTSAITEVENPGTGLTYCQVRFTGPAHMRWLENVSRGAILYLDYEVLDAEQYTFDFDPAINSVRSNFRGEDKTGLLDQSDFGSFALLPGVNEIAAFIMEEVEPGPLLIKFVPQHWSFDAVGAR